MVGEVGEDGLDSDWAEGVGVEGVDEEEKVHVGAFGEERGEGFEVDGIVGGDFGGVVGRDGGEEEDEDFLEGEVREVAVDDYNLSRWTSGVCGFCKGLNQSVFRAIAV